MSSDDAMADEIFLPVLRDIFVCITIFKKCVNISKSDINIRYSLNFFLGYYRSGSTADELEHQLAGSNG